ncbi:hypothetical protein LCGC14_1685330 [marine sediment metagenome]|uniref:Uncharacterized protein n=1 Tax=marine sediment metagenome TaxID=412755 RepID=A0A0F9HME8_9ZZZZ
MIVGIVGSRRRNSQKDRVILSYEVYKLNKIEQITKIVTGDCDKGADKTTRDIYEGTEGIELDIKRIKNPETGEEMDFNNHPWFEYYIMTQIFYARNEEIAKEPLDYLIALVSPDRKGGTENTIKHFKRHHKDWEKKLIII